MKNKNHIPIPPISDYPSRAGWEEACWQKIINSKELLQVVISPKERHDLVMRAAAIDRLQSGKSYREISRELWLSLQTIGTVKKILDSSTDCYYSYFERSKTQRKKKIYSVDKKDKFSEKKTGIPRKTKYGTIYLHRSVLRNKGIF